MTREVQCIGRNELRVSSRVIKSIAVPLIGGDGARSDWPRLMLNCYQFAAAARKELEVMSCPRQPALTQTNF